jgi:hypothetical protein
MRRSLSVALGRLVLWHRRKINHQGRKSPAIPIGRTLRRWLHRIRHCANAAAGAMSAREVPMIRPCLFACALATALVFPAQGASVSKTYSYFNIGGRTLV